MQAPFTMLITKTLLIGKPGYLNNLLKRRVILTHIRTSDDILLEGKVILEMLPIIVPSPPLFLVHGIFYHTIYARSNLRIVLIFN